MHLKKKNELTVFASTNLNEVDLKLFASDVFLLSAEISIYLKASRLMYYTFARILGKPSCIYP